MASYATLAQLKAYLRIASSDTTYDQLLSDTIVRASAFIDSFTGRKFGAVAGTDFTVTDEKYDGGRTSEFVLRQCDVRSVTSLSIGNTVSGYTALDSSGFIWYPTGRVVIGSATSFNRYNSNLNSSVAQGYQTIKVSYVYGVLGVPSDIEQACLDVCAGTFNSSKSMGLSSESMGDYKIQYDVTFRQVLKSDPDLMGTLKAYRMMRV